MTTGTDFRIDEPTLMDIFREQEALAVEPAQTALEQAFAALDLTDWDEEAVAILGVIVDVAKHRDEFSANEVRPHLPAGINTARIGRTFYRACELGLITSVRLTRSSDRGTHGKRVNVYRRLP